jgi:hypothetical protein
MSRFVMNSELARRFRAVKRGGCRRLRLVRGLTIVIGMVSVDNKNDFGALPKKNQISRNPAEAFSLSL